MDTLAPTCLLCGSDRLLQVLDLKAVPILCNQLWPDATSAKEAPKGRMDLVACRDCALLFNRAFDPAKLDYQPGYENALHFSPAFQAFAAELADHLVRSYGLVGKSVVEIGCGDGYVLDLLDERGVGAAIGYDPSVPATKRSKVEIVPEYFNVDSLDRDVDAILCRHVLEHIHDPLTFLAGIRQAIGQRTCPVYFEVPNAHWMVHTLSIWDVIYEHVTYWTRPAIETLFRRAGFEPTDIRTGFGSQFLMVEAIPSKPEDGLEAQDCLGLAIATMKRFAAAAGEEIRRWDDELGTLAARDGSAVIWGAGSKGITFANATMSKALTAMVDVNPRKRGLVAPGVGLGVIAPEDLPGTKADMILIANRQYDSEIRRTVAGMGLSPSFGVIAG